MNDIILTIFAIYFTISAIVCPNVFITKYDERFCSYHNPIDVKEFVVLLILGVILGWLVFPIIMFKGFIEVVSRMIERFEEERGKQ